MGSELVVFPELCYTGYSFMSGEQAARVCEKPDGPTFRFMQKAAISLKAYVAWGYVESDGRKLYNSATIVSPDGNLVTRYRKVNLWGTDFLWASPGIESAPVIQTELGLMSVIICRDLRDKIPNNIPRIAASGSRMFEDKRVDLVAACANWGKGGFPSTSWMDFATDNKCVLAVANRWGKEEVGSFVQDFGQGGSAIIEPDWTVHTNGLEFSQDCVVTSTLGGIR
jgi:predicted amidohydrolase